MEKQTPATEAQMDNMKPQLIKLTLELGPLVMFFLANAFGARIMNAFPLLTFFETPLIFATAVFMVAMPIALILSYILMKKLAVMPLVTLVVVLVFGGLTLWLKDAIFIKMKPTIVNGLFATVLLGGLVFGQSLLRYVFGEVYQLKSEGWRILTLRWGLFFIFLAVINEVVWRNFSDDFWVSFKVWGIMPITMIFAMTQLKILTDYAPNPDDEEAASR